MSDPDPAPEPAPPPPPPSAPPLYAQLTAGALLALYVGLTVAMMIHAGKSWDHVLLIYNGFTGFALAAAGVLLGTQVQQTTVNTARRDSFEARADATRVRQAALAADAALATASIQQPAPEMKAARDLLAKVL